MYKLYGDGIHDDTKAIQELIDNADNELSLPTPKVRYIISAPLEIPSNFKLSLPRFAEIKLAKNSNCVMLKNKTVVDFAERTERGLFDYVNIFSTDFVCENIEVAGGIWNYNNLEQKGNPLWHKGADGKWYSGVKQSCDLDNETMCYNGFIFLFYNVKNLRISSLTLKNPVTFAMTLDRVSYFSVDNLIFDFNYGNPLACNMDGVHLCGNCHFGTIFNLKGACYDDLVAINADEGSAGPITNITVQGIYSEDCHSAVRLLSANCDVKNIHISDVYGTYFQYCIGLTKYYQSERKGFFDCITLENIFASKAPRYEVYNHVNDWIYSIIQIDANLSINNLRITNLHRIEYINSISTFYFGENTEINGLYLDNISTQNYADNEKMPLVINHASVKNLHACAVYVDGEEHDVKADLLKKVND